MFAKTIVFSDAFLDMPATARCLYFTLGMVADDDGFVNNPKSIMRQCGAQEDDMKLLLLKKFVLSFDSGIIVIKHWRINNYLRCDRYSETKYKEEKDSLELDENGSYRLAPVGIPDGIPDGIPYSGYPQDRIGKVRTVKDKERKNVKKESSFIPPTFEEVSEYCAQRDSSVDPKTFFDYFTAGDWKDSAGRPVKNWKQKLITWERMDSKRGKPVSGDAPQGSGRSKAKWGIVYDNDP